MKTPRFRLILTYTGLSLALLTSTRLNADDNTKAAGRKIVSTVTGEAADKTTVDDKTSVADKAKHGRLRFRSPNDSACTPASGSLSEADIRRAQHARVQAKK